MKKWLAVLCAWTILLSLAACGTKDKTGTPSAEGTASATESKYVHDVDIMSYVRKGTIPELPVQLGQYMDHVKEAYGYSDGAQPSTDASDDAVSDPFAADAGSAENSGDAMDFIHHEEAFEMLLEEEYLQVTANVGEAYYMYKTRYEGYGISKIACMKNCFGFTVGATLKSDVLDSIALQPTLLDSVDPASVDFVPGASMMKFTAAAYTEGDYTVTFYFANDFLSFVTLEDGRYWYDDEA